MGELEHNYIAPRDRPETDFWWLDFVFFALERFLGKGVQIEVVERTGHMSAPPSLRRDFCMPTFKEGVVDHGIDLTVFPVTQHPREYSVASRQGIERPAVISFYDESARIVEHGRHTHMGGSAVVIEFLNMLDDLLLTVRNEVDGAFQNIYYVSKKHAATFHQCLELSVAPLLQGIRVLDQMPEARRQVHEARGQALTLCSEGALNNFCGLFACTNSISILRPDGYTLLDERGRKHVVSVLFVGTVLSGFMPLRRTRVLELLEVGAHTLIVTRINRMTPPRKVDFAGGVLARESDTCIRIRVVRLRLKDNLIGQFYLAELDLDLPSVSYVRVCSSEFVTAACSRLPGC